MRVLACALLLMPGALRAWSPNGHRAVALLAEDRLSSEARRAVENILGPGKSLAAVAPCADYIRDNRGAKCGGLALDPAPWSRPWHFIDIPIADSPSLPADLARYCPRGDCAPEALRAEARTLADGRASLVEKRLALIFLVHFMGDLHQPLHCATEILNGVDDHGGNAKPVTWVGAWESAFPGESGDEDESARELNLHSLWDRIIQPADSYDPLALSRTLKEKISGRDVSPWIAGDFISAAALESFAVSKGSIYPAYHAPGGSRIGPEYQKKMRETAFERLEKAGVRLAALLEMAFRGETP